MALHVNRLGQKKTPKIKKKNLVKLGISTIFELSLFHPSTQRQETRSLHIWPSLYQEARQVLPKEERP